MVYTDRKGGFVVPVQSIHPPFRSGKPSGIIHSRVTIVYLQKSAKKDLKILHYHTFLMQKIIFQIF